MKKLNVKNIYTAGELLENQTIIVEKGQIIGIEDCLDAVYDYENLAPALMDIHINGGEQYHFTADPTEAALRDIELSARKNGVGYVLPALITSSLENIYGALAVTGEYMRENPRTGIIGLHLEGPFISEKKRGAHISKYVRVPDDKLLEEIIKKGDKVLKMITIAPEYFTDRQISMLLEAGIAVSLGHTSCTYKRAMEAFDLGVNMVTHLFNAMSPFHHREPGLVGAALGHANVFTPVILDGIHSDFEAVKIALKSKGDKLFFISDALFQNHIKTEFKWEEFDAKLINGDYINSDGNLAGATISMADCVKNGVDKLGISLEKVLYKCTCIPADLLKLNVGKIAPSYPARFCTFDERMNEFEYLDFQ